MSVLYPVFLIKPGSTFLLKLVKQTTIKQHNNFNNTTILYYIKMHTQVAYTSLYTASFTP